MKRGFFLLLTILLSQVSFAQKKQNVYFLKNDGREVRIKDSADFVRIIQEPDSGTANFNLLEYYNNSQNTRKRLGYVSKFEPGLVYEGPLVSYYPNGKRKEVTYYLQGIPYGKAVVFYPNGQEKKILQYSQQEGMQQMLGYNKTVRVKLEAFYDSLGTQLVINGNGNYKDSGESSSFIEEGIYKEGLKEGMWTGLYVATGDKFEEKYEMGEFKEGLLIKKSGEQIKYKNAEELPVYPGGMQRFYEFVGKTYNYPEAARKFGIRGKVMVGFFVEKDGKLSDFKILENAGMGTGEEAVRVLRLSQNWTPGTQHGIPVRVSYTLPLVLNLSH